MSGVGAGRFFSYDFASSFARSEEPSQWSRDDAVLVSVKIRDRQHDPTLEVVIECRDPTLVSARRRFAALVKSLEEQWPTAELMLDTTGIKLPQTRKARKRWRQLYGLLRELRVDDRISWEENDTRIDTVSIADWRDRITNELGKCPSDRTLQKIKKAGDAGMLS